MYKVIVSVNLKLMARCTEEAVYPQNWENIRATLLYATALLI